MAIFMSRDGKVSVVRVGIFLAALGAIVIISGYILFSLEQRRFKSPLNIDLYPGAVEAGQSTRTSTSRLVFYHVADATPEQVAAYYDGKMLSFYDNSAEDLDRERCDRYPRAPEIFRDYVEGSGNVPYYFACGFADTSDSIGSGSRFTLVRIYPGVRNDSTGMNEEGLTVIVYEQDWQR